MHASPHTRGLRRGFLFSWKGRAWPGLPMLFYIMYCTAVTIPMVLWVPNLSNLPELKALQFPIQTLGAACSFKHTSAVHALVEYKLQRVTEV